MIITKNSREKFLISLSRSPDSARITLNPSWSTIRFTTAGLVGKVSSVIVVVGWVIYLRELLYEHIPWIHAFLSECKGSPCISVSTRLDAIYLSSVGVFIGYILYLLYCNRDIKENDYRSFYSQNRNQLGESKFNEICTVILREYRFLYTIEKHEVTRQIEMDKSYIQNTFPNYFSKNDIRDLEYLIRASRSQILYGHHTMDIDDIPIEINDSMFKYILKIYYIIIDHQNGFALIPSFVLSSLGAIIIYAFAAESAIRVLIKLTL